MLPHPSNILAQVDSFSLNVNLIECTPLFLGIKDLLKGSVCSSIINVVLDSSNPLKRSPKILIGLFTTSCFTLTLRAISLSSLLIKSYIEIIFCNFLTKSLSFKMSSRFSFKNGIFSIFSMLFRT